MARQSGLVLVLLLSGGCSALPTSTARARPEPLPYGVDLSFLHPVQKPAPDVTRVSAEVPDAVKTHVYIYLVNGFDPLYVGNFKGLSDYLKSLGYAHCYCGEMAQVALFRRHIREVRAADPAARFVLVGYSAGANSVRHLAHDLKADGIKVDLLAYVGGDTIKNVPYSRPENAGAILNITGHGLALLGYDLIFKGCDIDGAANHRLDVRHMQLPSHPQTAELLAQRLAALGQSSSPIQQTAWRGPAW